MEEGKSVERVEMGKMEPLEVAELPAPPAFTFRQMMAIIGPGAILLSMSIGSGEWIFGPAVAVQITPYLMWVATLGIFLQTCLNTEFVRYTLYTGEPIWGGFMRTNPGRVFWLWIYILMAIIQFGWPGWAASGGSILYAAFVGHIPTASERTGPLLMTYLMFGGCFVIMAFAGRKIERGLEIVSFLIAGWIIIFLVVVCIVFVPGKVWKDVFFGHFSFGYIPKVENFDWILLANLAAYAATGGVANCIISNWVRDKGYAMAGTMGYIPSLREEKKVTLSHIGRVFKINQENMAKWRGWWKYVYIDQWILYAIGCFAGMFLCTLLAVGVIPHGTKITGLAVGGYQAQFLGERAGRALYFLTLFNGFWIMFGTQLAIMDMFVRFATDAFWMGSERARNWAGGNPRKIYYTILVVLLAWGVIGITAIPKPFKLLQIGATASSYWFTICAIHVLVVNTKFLPKELRASKIKFASVAACGAFYLVFAIIVTGRLLGAW